MACIAVGKMSFSSGGSMNTSCCTNPIRINTLLIKNRIVFPAMCTKYAAPDGGVTERMLRYYEERAKGGAGLVTIEATSVDPTGNSFSRGLSIADDARLFMRNLTVSGILQKSFLLLDFGNSIKQGKIVLPESQAILFDLSV